MTTFLTRSGILRYVCSPVIEFDTPGLATPGIPFATLRSGTFVYDAGIFVPLAFDGTTPQADIGMFHGGNTDGWYAGVGAAVDLTNEDVINNSIDPGALGSMLNNTLLQLVGTSTGYLSAWVSLPGPLRVVASRDGSLGGTPLDSTVGQLVAWALVSG